jgi:hypothetical protein
MTWIDLDQGSDKWWDPVNTVLNFQVVRDAGGFLITLGTISLSRRRVLHGVRYTYIQCRTTKVKTLLGFLQKKDSEIFLSKGLEDPENNPYGC